MKIKILACFLLISLLGTNQALAYGGGSSSGGGGGGTPMHGECQNYKCVMILGSGLEMCSVDADCWPAGYNPNQTSTGSLLTTRTASGSTLDTGLVDTDNWMTNLLEKLTRFNLLFAKRDKVTNDKIVGEEEVPLSSNITRGELVKILVEVENGPLALIPTRDPFRDVPKAFVYAKHIFWAKNKGWIIGYLDGTFRPKNNINRVEALKMILLAEFTRDQISGGVMNFKDTIPGAWYEPFVAFAYKKGFVFGYGAKGNPNGYFGPDQIIQRSELAAIIKRILRSQNASQSQIDSVDKIVYGR